MPAMAQMSSVDIVGYWDSAASLKPELLYCQGGSARITANLPTGIFVTRERLSSFFISLLMDLIDAFPCNTAAAFSGCSSMSLAALMT